MTGRCRSGFSPILCFFSLLLLAVPLATHAAERIHQLRIYEIFDHNKQAFHDRFRDHAMRIMKKHDFNIVAMWEAKNGARTEETAAKYGNLVGEIQDRTLQLTTYSPRANQI
jgi:hypothetical protein